MFEPGYYRFSGFDRRNTEVTYYVHIRYGKQVKPDYQAMLYFQVNGEVNGQKFAGFLELYRDTAFNFASPLSRLLAKNGVPVSKGLIMHRHEDYDLMFKDIQSLLELHYGEPINPDHIGAIKL